jgi:hypothetical protein
MNPNSTLNIPGKAGFPTQTYTRKPFFPGNLGLNLGKETETLTKFEKNSLTESRSWVDLLRIDRFHKILAFSESLKFI